MIKTISNSSSVDLDKPATTENENEPTHRAPQHTCLFIYYYVLFYLFFIYLTAKETHVFFILGILYKLGVNY